MIYSVFELLVSVRVTSKRFLTNPRILNLIGLIKSTLVHTYLVDTLFSRNLMAYLNSYTRYRNKKAISSEYLERIISNPIKEGISFFEKQCD